MNSLIGMIADFLEHLSGPAFGRQENEAYNLRLGILLDNDEAFAGQLANTYLGSEDVPSLSLGTWLWYLRWRTLRGGALPSDAFLDELYDASAEPIVRLRVVDTVVMRLRREPAVLDQHVPARRGLSGLPDSWLRRRMESIVGAQEGEDSAETGVARAEEAWELAAYLLQLGDDVSLAALGALLAEQWNGRYDLVAQIEQVLGRPGLEPDVVEQLRQRLGLPRLGDE
jgi:hypothetical protein